MRMSDTRNVSLSSVVVFTFPWASFIISEVAGKVGRILVGGALAMLELRVVQTSFNTIRSL